MKFGMIPELMGRLPVITALSGMNEDTLVKILTEPKNSLIKQYVKLFEMDNVTITFENKALKAIAKKAIEQRSGARGLRTILEDILMDLMFTVPSDETIEKITITEAAVNKKSLPRIVHNPERESGNLLKQDEKPAKRRKSTAS